jgi:hypothetical protein
VNRACWIVAFVVVVALAGCGDKKTTEPPEQRDPEPAVKPERPAQPPAKDVLTSERVDKEVRAQLKAWVAAQNAADFNAYIGMYQRRYFKGIKRTTSGKVKKMDFAGWKADRGRMFENKPVVAAESAEVATWLDPGADLKTGVSEVRFTQRWKTDRYADHGIKLLRFWRDPKGGQHIVYEDLLNAEPGWDRTADADVTPLVWSPPASEAEALALWQKLAPTGKDYQDKLAAIPNDPAIRGPMARALLAEGKLACEETIQYGECGMEAGLGEEVLDEELAPLDPKSTIASPCLRRRLALWAFDQLSPDDILASGPALVAIAGLPTPEQELIDRVFAAVASADEKLRLSVLEAAVEAKHTYTANKNVAGLSEAALVRAARDLELTKALEQLSPDRHSEVYAAALNSPGIDIDVRRTIVDSLAKVKGEVATKALTTAVDDTDCWLAMSAAEALAGRGDSSYLPKRPKSANLSENAKVLCMITHDDEDAKGAVWQQYVSPKGGVSIATEVVNDFDEPYDEDGDGDGDGDGDEEEDDDETTEVVTRADADATDLFEQFGRWGISCDDAKMTCMAGSEYDRYVRVTFAKAPDGGLYVSEVRSYEWNGCGC